MRCHQNGDKIQIHTSFYFLILPKEKINIILRVSCYFQLMKRFRLRMHLVLKRLEEIIYHFPKNHPTFSFCWVRNNFIDWMKYPREHMEPIHRVYKKNPFRGKIKGVSNLQWGKKSYDCVKPVNLRTKKSIMNDSIKISFAVLLLSQKILEFLSSQIFHKTAQTRLSHRWLLSALKGVQLISKLSQLCVSLGKVTDQLKAKSPSISF